MDVGALIQAVATVVALVGVIVSFAITRRGQKQDLDLAKQEADRSERAQRAGEASAERAERAASLTIDSLSHMADALDRIADQSGTGGTLLAAAVPDRVKWSLRHFQGDKYILENVGTATAHAVTVSADESLPLDLVEPNPADVDPGGVRTFFAIRTMATGDSTITVQWFEDKESDEVQRWRYPLPPRR